MSATASRLLLVALLTAATPVGATEVREFKDPVEQQRYERLVQDLRCLVCQNQSLADSDADLAQDLRDEVFEIIRSGKSDAEAVRFLVDRYGDFVLYRPPFNATTLLLWFGPVLLLVGGLLFIWRRTRRRVPDQAVSLSAAERSGSPAWKATSRDNAVTVFFSLAVLMVLLGLALFWPVLLGRSQRSTTRRADLNVLIHKQRRRELAAEAIEAEQAVAIQAELDRALLNDLDVAPTDMLEKPPAAGRAALIGALLTVSIGGIALYGQLGRMDLLQSPPISDAATREALQGTIEQLAAKLAKNPNDLEGWVLLGRSLQATEAPRKALTAFEFARKLAPDNLDVTALYAQALAEAEGGSMAGQPTELVDEVLARDPNHPTALWLAGLAAAERRDAQAAIAHWQRLATQLPADSEEHRTLAEYIARAEAMAPAAGGPPPVPGPSTARTRITVRVTLAPTLKDRAAPEDSVFVFARAVDGPPMPLAVVRRQVKDLPLEVTLDDSMAMMESRKLSSFERILIGARVSKSGKPTPSPGDLQGLSAPVASATTTTQIIEIRDIVP